MKFLDFIINYHAREFVKPLVEHQVLKTFSFFFFRHESANGYYRCSSFFISKVVCDVIPLRLVPILLFSCIAYFLVGFQTKVDNFFVFVVTLLLISLSAGSICLLVSSSFGNIAIANLFVSLPFVLMMVSLCFCLLYRDIFQASALNFVIFTFVARMLLEKLFLIQKIKAEKPDISVSIDSTTILFG